MQGAKAIHTNETSIIRYEDEDESKRLLMNEDWKMK